MRLIDYLLKNLVIVKKNNFFQLDVSKTLESITEF